MKPDRRAALSRAILKGSQIPSPSLRRCPRCHDAVKHEEASPFCGSDCAEAAREELSDEKLRREVLDRDGGVCCECAARSCLHCGAPYDERRFAAHGQFCPHTLSGRFAAQFVVERLTGCTPGVMADVIAQEMRKVREAEREACATEADREVRRAHDDPEQERPEVDHARAEVAQVIADGSGVAAMLGDWWASLRDDELQSGPHDKREQAVMAARELIRDWNATAQKFDEDARAYAFVLQEVYASLGEHPVSVEAVLEDVSEHLAEQLADEDPERDCPLGATGEQINDLQRELDAAFLRWMERHGITPPRTMARAERVDLEDASDGR